MWVGFPSFPGRLPVASFSFPLGFFLSWRVYAVWCGVLIQFNGLFRSFGVFLETCCCKFWADVRGFYWSPFLATSQPLVCVYVCVYVVCVCVCVCVLLRLIQFNDLFRSLKV